MERFKVLMGKEKKKKKTSREDHLAVKHYVINPVPSGLMWWQTAT